MVRKSLLAFGVLAGISLITWITAVSLEYTSKHSDGNFSPPGSSKESSTDSSSNSADLPQESPTSGEETAPRIDAARGEQSRKELLEAQARWERAHGFFTRTEPQDYGKLSDTELERLGESGDIAALQYLASRFVIKDPRRAIQNFEHAAALGSTYALLSLASLWEPQKEIDSDLQLDGKDVSPDIAALSYALVGELRGSNSTVTKIQSIIEGAGLSDEQIQTACQNAIRKYDELERQRINLGLSQFDNSPAPMDRGARRPLICARGK